MSAPIVFIISFILRFAFIPLSGFKADIAYWKWWGMSAAHDGLSGPLVNTAYNYPSFYLYTLKATSHLYELLTGYNFKLNPQDFVFWNDRNFLYLLLIKLPYILADLGIGFLIYKIVKLLLTGGCRARGTPVERPQSSQSDDKAVGRGWSTTGPALVAAALYLFNPVVIYNSSIWGQTDSIGSLFVLIAFYGLITNSYWLIAIFSALALFMKTQTIIFIPLLLLAWFLKKQITTKDGFSSLIKTVWLFMTTVIIINFPFLATKTMDRVFDIMYTSQLYFPYVSMNAYNLWWIFFGKLSSSFWDQNLIANLITFKTMGVLLFGSVYFYGICLIVKTFTGNQTQKTNKKHSIMQAAIFDLPYDNILFALTFVSFGFFLLLTQMHERYIFPVFVFFPVLIGLYLPQLKKPVILNWKSIIRELLKHKSFMLLTSLFLILSITTIINLHQVMIMNYPDNTLFLLPNVFSEPLTKLVAIINVIVFIILFLYAVRKLPVFINLGVLFSFFVLMFLVSIPRLLISDAQIISLTKLKPVSTHQDFGNLEVNKNLSNSWMSAIYYFSLHGLATHANSGIVYNLSGQYKFFSTNFGIDTDANTNASVHFIIKGDNKILFKSGVIGRLNNPGYTKVGVSGINSLELVVDDAGDGINSDHADWLEPRLYK